MRRGLAAVTAADLAPDGLPVTDDFIAIDRRSGINFGQLDGPGWLAFLALIPDIGSGRADWSMPEVIAVRGERSAAVSYINDYGDDRRTEAIASFRLDASLVALERIVYFDLADREAAIAELDRLQAEIDDGPATSS